jgi:hypothetical protein
MILTLTLSVRVRTVPVKLSFCAVKVPMFAMMNLLLVVQGRAHRGLVGDPKGEVRAVASRSGRNAVEDREEQEICCARKARSAGEICWAGRLQP